MTAKRNYGNKLVKIKNFILDDGIMVIQLSNMPLRRRIQGDLSSSKVYIYTNAENALEAVSDGSQGGLWLMR